MQALSIKTKKSKEVVDITDAVEEKVGESGVKSGMCHLFILHTTACLTTGDLDPGTDLDILDAFDAMVPKLKYQHPHDPAHVPDHILSSLIGPSLTVPVQDGRLGLGTWQRVLLIEFDGPRERKLVITLIQ